MRDKQERTLIMRVLPAHVERATPQDPAACTLACAAKDIGLDDVKLSYDQIGGNVIASWEALETDSRTGEPRMRVFHATVEPLKEAVQILITTDLDKRRLARVIPTEGWELHLVARSRWKQRQHQGRPGYVAPKGGTAKRKPHRTASRMYAKP